MLLLLLLLRDGHFAPSGARIISVKDPGYEFKSAYVRGYFKLAGFEFFFLWKWNGPPLSLLSILLLKEKKNMDE